MDSRYYPGVEADAPKLMVMLGKLFDEGYEVQTMQVGATSVLQARKESTLRDLTGMSSALTIKVTAEHGGTRVEIGMQRWFDKAAVAAVAVILSSGLLLALPALGAYWQHQPDGRRVESDRGAHRGARGRLRPAAARALRHLRRGQQRRLGLLLDLRREPARRPHL